MPFLFPSSVTKKVRLALLHKCNGSRKRREEVTTLDYSHSNLISVPDEIYFYENTLEILHLEANCLQDLPKWLFQCHALRQLIVSDNELDCLPPSISSLTNLERLNLSRNELMSIPDNIRYCKHLTSIDCSSNRLERLCEGLTMLINLQELYLNDTLLEFLPGNFGRLTELRILEMRATRLRLLPVTLPKLIKLERIDLGTNSFVDFPVVLTNLPSLAELWLDSNKLSNLDDSIDQLTKLTFLDLSNNQLTELPQSIGQCSLIDLHVSDNELVAFPESISNLKRLEILTANNNRLERLPVNIGYITSLVELHLSFNNLTSIPSSIGLLNNLQFLTLDHNQIQSIPPSIGSCTRLSVLSLRSNRLTYLPDEIGRLAYLKVLNVSGNCLRYLPCTLLKLKNLQALWMNENQAKPLIAFEQERHPVTGQRVLTCILLPQIDPSMVRMTSKNRFISEQTIAYVDRPITLRFANDTIDEPRQFVRNPTPYPKEMRAFASILRNYNNHQRQIVHSPQKHSSSSNLLMVGTDSNDFSPHRAYYERAHSSSIGSMNSDPLRCPLARSHDDLLCYSPTNGVSGGGGARPDLLQGQIEDIDEIKNFENKNKVSSIEMDTSKAEAENIEPSVGKEMLEKYWADVKTEIDDINIVEFRTTDLPLARIKKIMKLDDDVKMISAEVPILFAKAAELFIQELTIHSWLQTEESRRRTLQRNDVAAAISKNELFDFLIDIVPREEATKTHKKKEAVSEVQYIVTLPTSTGMGNTIQLPNGQIIQLPQNLSSNIVTMASPQGTQQQYTIGP